ncbi:MAG: choice-of-anchor D domain-containing protein [Deltaproteobacteria bacterium]|nr:choice-of-anchor D domain-containing protein [Deltaproteobacteria bacterium]
MVVLTALFAPACGDKGPGFLLVTVEPPTPAVASISKLDVSATIGGDTRSAPTLAPPRGAASFTLPASLALDFGDRSGVATVVVVARDSAGVELVRGSSMATVVAGDTHQVTVKLGTMMMLPDAGVPDGGGNPAVLQITPTGAVHDFGTQTIGTFSADTMFTVANTGGTQTSQLTVRKAGSNAGDFNIRTDGCSGMTLAVGASCNFNVQFLPASVGTGASGADKTATLEVLATGATTQSVALIGKATCFLLTPAPPYNFGNVQSFNSTTIPITVRNQCSAAAGPLDSPTFGGTHATLFTVDPSTTCSFGSGMLANSATCLIAVKFTPASAGAKTATMTLSTSTTGAFGGSILAALMGTGT